jgi:hypothetical protein
MIGQNEALIKDLEDERARVKNALSLIVIPKSMDVRKRYAEEVKTAMEEKAGYEVELKEIGEKLEALRPQVVTSGERLTSYDFYSGIFGIRPEWIQIFIHTVLSVFFALMGPVSLKNLLT